MFQFIFKRIFIYKFHKIKYYLSIGFIFMVSTGIFSEAYNPECVGRIKLIKVIDCVLEHSPEYRNVQLEVKVLQGKKKVNAYLFPSNPIISISNSLRSGSDSGFLGNSTNQVVPNGEIAVSQEIFTSPQRAVRLNIIEKSFALQGSKIEMVFRNTVAEAIISSIQYEYSRKILKESLEIYNLSKDIHTAIRARVEKGLTAPVDMDLAESELVKNAKMYLTAKKNFDSHKANLTVMMGVPFMVDLDILEMPSEIEVKEKSLEDLLKHALEFRPEINISEKEIQILKRKNDLLHLEKVPNITFGGFVQRDGFQENVIGARLSLPLRIWRDNSGEIFENRALTEQAVTVSEVREHSIKGEVIKAFSGYFIGIEELKNYSEDLLSRVNISLQNIKKAISLGQMPLREALLTQQSLVNLRLSYLETRRDLLISGIELIRASGMPLIGKEEKHEN